MQALTDYLEAVNAINNAEREFDRIRDITIKAATAMSSQWALVSVSGLPEPHVPEKLSNQPRRIIDGTAWPTAEQIARVLERLHKAYDEAVQAWGQIAPECRARFTPPPSKIVAERSAASTPSDHDVQALVPRIEPARRGMRRRPIRRIRKLSG